MRHERCMNVHERLWCFVHEAFMLHQCVLSCVFVDASFLLYSPSTKIRPPATFVFASGRMFALLQVLSGLENIASSAYKYFIYFYPKLIILLIYYIFQNKRYKTSISLFHWQCFDASDSHLQVSLFFTYYVCSSLILYRFHYAEYLELCASVGATPKARPPKNWVPKERSVHS